MKKRLYMLFAAFGAALLLAGCAALDVVQFYGRESLGAIHSAYRVLFGEDASGLYARLSVDGETALLVSRDFAQSGTEDVLIQTSLAPFVDAGLDVSQLGEGYRADGASLFITADYGEGKGNRADFMQALFAAVEFNPSLLTYHEELDHFGIVLPRGKFEWAKDHTANDKDIVFVLDADALRALGVDVANVSGWTLVTMRDEGGAEFDVLLKPYALAS